MSTSTQGPRVGGSDASSRASQPRWQRRRLSPVKGLIFIAAAMITLVAIILNYDAVWDVLVQFAPWFFELVTDFIVGAFELVGMAPGAAGWAAIYLGAVVALALLYVLIRKAMAWNRFIRDTWYDYRAMYAHLFSTWSTGAHAGIIAWWGGLDGLGRAFAVAGGILVLIPLLLALSVGLGMLVAVIL